MKVEEVNLCQIQEWYPKFKPFSIKTLIHHLPESFVHYLLDDSSPFLLPLSISNDDALPNRVFNPVDEPDFQLKQESDDDSDQPTSPPSFPDLESDVKHSISSLGGSVFPKLNWSAPKDSAWISPNGTLKCSSFSEIALLLRSSDSLVHDLCHAYDSCTDKSSSRPSKFFLALRKWYPSLRPEMEFRCFVKNRNLIGISQREVTTFYPAVVEKKERLREVIREFFIDHVKANFELENYTFDVYVTRNESVKILDFNPWGAFTLPLLFDWEELEEEEKEEEEKEEIDLRIVESRRAVRPGLKTAVPFDYLDMSSGSGWDQFLKNADQEFQHQMRDDND